MKKPFVVFNSYFCDKRQNLNKYQRRYKIKVDSQFFKNNSGVKLCHEMARQSSTL